MELKFNDDQLQKMIGLALVQAMDQQGKDALIQSALTYLVTQRPESSSYNARRTSPIEQAFESAIYRQAEIFAREVVASNDFSEKMQALVVEAANRVFANDQREIIISKIAAGIQKAIQREY